MAPFLSGKVIVRHHRLETLLNWNEHTPHRWSVFQAAIRRHQKRSVGRRGGIGVFELLLVLLVMTLLGLLLAPAVVHLREVARRQTCTSRLHQIGSALESYLSSYRRLPPAAIWRSRPGQSIALHASKRFERTTHENWAISLLPFLNHADLAKKYDTNLFIGHSRHQEIRESNLTEFTCPSDSLHSVQNRYIFSEVEGAAAPICFARGNYGINGGTHNPRWGGDSASAPLGDRSELIMDLEIGEFRMLGNGIAGFNAALDPDTFENGRSTLVAVEELRAGLSPGDLRGVWALGQIGSSVTWGHGIAGDDCGPNNNWERADDIIGCAKLHKSLGKEAVLNSGMPCVNYIDSNDQATSRSQHLGGVNVVFLDGRVRFVADQVDPSLWHVMHSRQTPAATLSVPNFAQQLQERPIVAEAANTNRQDSNTYGEIEPIINSIGMKFVPIPSGKFTMGIPDVGNGGGAPPECPPHDVSIPRNFLLGKYEVTQEQFLRVAGRNPSHHTPERTNSVSTASFPVESVSWVEANQFCRDLSDLPEEKAARRSYRLPTEAEWEYACRAGQSLAYHWRSVRDPQDDSGENAGVRPPLPIAPTGSYRANRFGLHDMRGGVWEWCSDWFDRRYYGHSPETDPRGPVSGYIKVVRGGDWTFVGETCRINYPMMAPWKSSPFVGFRVICEPQKAE
ncbi:MAG: hypothetical protein JWP89_6184 [Schlesneria sp.]|nr:hypothetical protein [Schlesneria sp.]